MRRDWLETGQALQRMRVYEGPLTLSSPVMRRHRKVSALREATIRTRPTANSEHPWKLVFKQGSRLRWLPDKFRKEAGNAVLRSAICGAG